MRFTTLFLAAIFVFAAETARSEDLPAPRRITVPSPSYGRLKDVAEETARLVEARDTAGLEALAGNLRQSRVQLETGMWVLSSFYGEATDLPERRDQASERVEFFKKWAADCPQSITAQVCYANSALNFALMNWRTAASKVEADRIFDRETAQLSDRLEKAKGLKEKCPGRAAALLNVALKAGWDRTEFFTAANEAMAAMPDYGEYQWQIFLWFLSHGKHKEFYRWIADEADKAAADKRDWRYAQLVWLANGRPVMRASNFRDLDWPRTRRGFEQWVKKDPKNLAVRFEFENLALQADDRETLREQFSVTGGQYFAGGWNEESFEKAREFAFGKVTNPAKILRIGSLSFYGDSLKWLLIGYRVFWSAVGGLLIGAFFLVLAMQRKDAEAGIMMLMASAILSAVFGTLITIPVGVGLYIYFRKKRPVYPPRVSFPTGWRVLLWTILLTALNVALLFGSLAVILFALMGESAGMWSQERLKAELAEKNGLLIAVKSAWIVLLGLLCVCGPQARSDWKSQLGLVRGRGMTSLPWIVGAVVIMFVLCKVDMAYDTEPDVIVAHTSVVVGFVAALATTVVQSLLLQGYAFSGWIKKMGPGWTLAAIAAVSALYFPEPRASALICGFLGGATLTVLRWKTGSVYPCLAVSFATAFAQFLMESFTAAPK